MKIVFDGQTDIDELKKLPETPGVYFFLGERKEILYIGKATILRDRVRSYFSSDIMESRGPKIAKMLSLASAVGWISTDSVLEALIFESRLIKDRQPPYNTDAKDDKSYNHVVITDEEFPRVLLVRGRDLAEGKFVAPIRSLFGPFPHGTQLREVMKIIRKMFPYRDRCESGNKKQGTRSKEQNNELSLRASLRARHSRVGELGKTLDRHATTETVGTRDDKKGKPCFHRQIGLCPGVCTGEISAREYGKTVRNIERFFNGKKRDIIASLKREMNIAASKLEFERAGTIRNTIFALGHIQDAALLVRGADNREQGMRGIRIEAYDVAHLSGASSVGVMTVCLGDTPEKNEYRKFILRGKHIGNDLSALGEILRRRLKHREWPSPDIIVVDGGFLQFGVAEKLFIEHGQNGVRLVGVVKNRKHQPERLIGDRIAIAEYRRAILLANAEAHRFAITFHRKRRGKEFLRG